MKNIILSSALLVLGASAQDSSAIGSVITTGEAASVTTIDGTFTVITTGVTASATATGIASSVGATPSATDSQPAGYTEFPGKPNIASILSRPELSSLKSLLQQQAFSQFYDNLVNNFISFTFLAPSNDALQKYMDTDAGKMFTANSSFAQDVLYYHFLNGPFKSTEIPEGGILQSNWSTTLYSPPGVPLSNQYAEGFVGAVNDNDTVYFIGGYLLNSTVDTADLQFNQGYVHIIDSVLTLPGNLSSTLTAGNFQALLGAFNETSLGESALTANENSYTLFAPTNQAFANIGSALTNLDATNLTNILKYHVHQGPAVFADQSKDGMEITTLDSNTNLTITMQTVNGTDEYFVNGAKIIAPNLVTEYGVVHGIDQVLNPEETSFLPASNADQGVNQFPGASSVGDLGTLTSGQPTATSAIVLPSEAASETSIAGAMPMVTGAAGMGMMVVGAAAVVGGW